MKSKILIIEDEKSISLFLQMELEHEGYFVDVAYDGEAGLKKAYENEYSLILLDIMLPKINGFEICRKLRKTQTIPIIMITAKSDVTDKVNGLDLGADDYLTKPFEIEELFARIRRLLKKSNNSKTDIITVKDLVLNRSACKVERQGINIELTKKEYELLEYLIINKNITLSRDRILQEIWGYDFNGDTKIVDVFIRYLRLKVDDKFDEKLIKTVRGFGYLVEDENDK